MDRQEQMKQMIRKEIQSISSLEERIILKELMEGVFLSLYETNVEMYRQLEDRVMDELAYDVNQYLIKTGIVERDYLDPTHHFMTVMREEDWKRESVSVKAVRQAIAKDGKYLLGTVFIKCDLLDIQKIVKEQKQYRGMIRTSCEYSVQIHLEHNQSYLAEIEHLYHLFIRNGIPWQTVNAPYLFKLVDVYAVELDEECQDKEMIESFRIDIGDRSSLVCYDMVPIWNVWHLKLDGVGFPVACEDHKNYEHTISIADYGEEFIYMIDEVSGITSVRQKEGQLLVTSQIEMPKTWDIYSIRNGQEGRVTHYTYPVMENLRVDGFAERFQRKIGQVVKTRGELERFIRGFGLEQYLEYRGCSLMENVEAVETYSMNSFMKDEVREDKRARQLILFFRSNTKDAWIVRDLMSFITSEVQELYPEYQCGGKLE